MLNLGNGKNELVVIYQNDDPNKITEDLCKKYCNFLDLNEK